MNLEILAPETIRWAIALVLGFPLLMVILGEVALRLDRAKRPLGSTLRLVRNLVLPTLAVLLLCWKIIGLPQTSTAIRVLETLFWITLIHACLSFVNDVLFDHPAPGSWQARMPKLLLDLGRLILVIIGASLVLSMVWGLDLSKLAAALGIGSIVIGLALQEPLGNVFAGLMLLIERPVALGDWIEVGDTTGRVVEVNWRSVHVETMTREIHVIPNSELNKGTFSNLSRPTPLRTVNIDLGFSYDDPPNRVKEVLLPLLRDTPGVLDAPAPLIRTMSYDDFAITYRIIFSVSRQEDLYATRDMFMTRVWYAVQRSGLTIPFPIVTQIRTNAADLAASKPAPMSLLKQSFPQLLPQEAGSTEPSLLEDIAPEIRIRSFAARESVVNQGELLEGLYLILSGQVDLLATTARGDINMVATLGRGDYFGESAILSGRRSELTVVATEDLDVLVIPPDSAHLLLASNPRLAREIGIVLEQRRRTAAGGRRGRDSTSSAEHAAIL